LLKYTIIIIFTKKNMIAKMLLLLLRLLMQCLFTASMIMNGIYKYTVPSWRPAWWSWMNCQWVTGKGSFGAQDMIETGYDKKLDKNKIW